MGLGLTYKTEEDIFRENIVADVPYLSFSLLSDYNFITHGFSTRLGGVSTGIYSSMNLTFARDDDPAAVIENFHRITSAIGVSYESLVFSQQSHTANVKIVTAADRGKGITSPLDYNDIDGMITDVPGICLTTFYADCVPLFFVDPVRRVIALSHSGWRGTAGRIGQVTVTKMISHYGCDPAHIRAAIGPSICQECYEVSTDVIREFQKTFDPLFWKQLFYQKDNGQYQLNLWAANRIVLSEAGILDDHLAVTNLCTCCNHEFLFSHRASQGQRGNLGAFISLVEE